MQKNNTLIRRSGIAIPALLFVMTCLMIACAKKQQPTPAPTTPSIVGNWGYVKVVDYGGDTPYTVVLTDCQKASVWTFADDSTKTFTLTTTCAQGNFNGTYKLEKNVLAIWNAGKTNLAVEGPITFSKNADTLVIDDKSYDGYVYTMVREGH